MHSVVNTRVSFSIIGVLLYFFLFVETFTKKQGIYSVIYHLTVRWKLHFEADKIRGCLWSLERPSCNTLYSRFFSFWFFFVVFPSRARFSILDFAMSVIRCGLLFMLFIQCSYSQRREQERELDENWAVDLDRVNLQDLWLHIGASWIRLAPIRDGSSHVLFRIASRFQPGRERKIKAKERERNKNSVSHQSINQTSLSFCKNLWDAHFRCQREKDDIWIRRKHMGDWTNGRERERERPEQQKVWRGNRGCKDREKKKKYNNPDLFSPLVLESPSNISMWTCNTCKSSTFSHSRSFKRWKTSILALICQWLNITCFLSFLGSEWLVFFPPCCKKSDAATYTTCPHH